MIIVPGGVTAPHGFVANGIRAGLKVSGKRDLALLYSEVPAVAAGSFTTNVFRASPVRICASHIGHKMHHAVIVNSGNANCVNGKIGDQLAVKMTTITAKALGINPREVLVASTGIIGRALPIEKIRSKTPELVLGLSRQGSALFAEAIMTTDILKKEVAVKIKLGKATVTIGGACKGVGMIYPQMKTLRHATMLAFLTTDAAISKKMLESALSEAVEDTFNMVSVDGDMSTNDTCLILANGLAGNVKIVSSGRDFLLFVEALKYVSGALARMIAQDGEGATKLVAIEVAGAKTPSEARQVARKISTSSLLKCCIFGQDPNWGRVAAAAGSSGVPFDPEKVDIYLGGIKVLSNGGLVKEYDLSRVKAHFKKRDIEIKLDLKRGSHARTAWTCDFSKEYVEINSEYST